MKATIEAMIPQDAANHLYSRSGGTRDMLLVIAAACLVGCIVAGWAVFLRRRRDTPYALTDKAPRPTRRRRSRRSEAERRNPTLAETGGLRPRDNHPSRV